MFLETNTRWTKANGPYIFNGDVIVTNRATLTIGAGTTVNLNDYKLEVEGTLVARGTDIDQIHFNGDLITSGRGSISLVAFSTLGSIIDDAIINGVSIRIGATPFEGIGKLSPKISNCTLVDADISITS